MKLKSYKKRRYASAAFILLFGCIPGNIDNSSKYIANESCNLDELTFETIRENVKTETIEEISDIIQNHIKTGAEKGGYVYFKDRIIVQERQNANDNRINQLKTALNYGERSEIEDIIKDIKLELRLGYASGKCSIGASDEYWQNSISTINEMLDSEDIEVIRKAIDKYIKILSSTYVMSTSKITKKGRKIGKMHTHNSGMAFSATDKCISVEYDDFNFLASYKKDNPSSFDFYVACGEKEELIGTYNVAK